MSKIITPVEWADKFSRRRGFNRYGAYGKVFKIGGPADGFTAVYFYAIMVSDWKVILFQSCLRRSCK